MQKALLTAAALILVTVTGAVSAERPTRFWNLTHNTISEFQLAPAGSTRWGANQRKNDKDRTVVFDECLRIPDSEPERYDGRITTMSRSVCFARSTSNRAVHVLS